MTTNDKKCPVSTTTKKTRTDTTVDTTTTPSSATTSTSTSTATTIATLTKSQCRKLQECSTEKERHYTMVVMAVIVTTAMTVRFPGYYWIWHFLRTIFYLPVRFIRFRNNGWVRTYTVTTHVTVTIS